MTEALPPWAVGLEPLLRECHRRLSKGTVVTRVRVGSMDRAQQDAVADLFGLAARPAPGASFPLTSVDLAMRELTGRALHDVLVGLFGPIKDARSQRASAADERASLWGWLGTHDVVRARRLEAWADDLRVVGVRGSVDTTRVLLERALQVLAALPSPGEPLPVFAGRLLNDTHALDAGSALAGVVLGALAHEQGLARPDRAADRRALWRSVGVLDDELSSTVLVSGLAATGSAPADQMCRVGVDTGQAVSLTLAAVRAGVPVLPSPGDAFVVENPAILALASALPAAVVCVSGWPSGAAIELLLGLRAQGHVLRYHGDLDGEGVRIAEHVIAETGAEPWRMSTQDYLTRVAAHGAPVGRVTEASWDPELAGAMRLHGVAVLEETVWEDLRGDLDVYARHRDGGRPRDGSTA